MTGSWRAHLQADPVPPGKPNKWVTLEVLQALKLLLGTASGVKETTTD